MNVNAGWVQVVAVGEDRSDRGTGGRMCVQVAEGSGQLYVVVCGSPGGGGGRQNK